MLRKILKITAIVLAAGVIAAQFIRPNFTNPPVVAGETLAASTHVPADVQQIITRSCNDCHTNQTDYPWYSKITPFNWFLADHIEEGRHELNFSAWNTYSTEKKVKKLEEICEQVEHAYMPLPSYLWIHRDAVLAESQAQALCNWAKSESVRLSSAEN
jgi:hypothetical protein